MRLLLPLLLCLLLGNCSCSRKPEPQAELATTAALPQAGARTDDQAALAKRQALDAQQQAHLLEAAGVLHAYLADIASGRLDQADAQWTGGKPAPVPDDAALRALGPRTMRINSDAPKPLDPDQYPSRSLEIPVHLQVADAQGRVQHWDGWYRLRRKIGNDGWTLSSASIRPQLD
ncbi:hypothetical protein [Pseudoxanthomonas winnipegensis]|uniref:hypothetical protein n=1 Tax=Pseudoxanthomonas winnipegensis TaxID=2480810 RepID=UPI0030F47C40